MRDFEKLFDSCVPGSTGLTLLSVKSPLRIYYGVGALGNLRLGFLADATPPEFQSTRAIKVMVVPEGETSNWVLFDLVETSARAVYFTFCDDLVSVLENAAEKSEEEALLLLKNRFVAWRQMFRLDRTPLSDEQIVGLLGELYFLDQFMIPTYSASEAVKAWSGIDGLSKDYSVGSKWYEVKTASVNATTVRINSLAQLSSETPGALVVVRYEAMSEAYDDPTCCVAKLFKSVMKKIEDDEVRVSFVSKLIAFGFDVTGNEAGRKYKISNMSLYKVDDGFPRIQVSDVKRQEIDKVTYSLIINALEDYKFDGVL